MGFCTSAGGAGAAGGNDLKASFLCASGFRFTALQAGLVAIGGAGSSAGGAGGSGGAGSWRRRSQRTLQTSQCVRDVPWASSLENIRHPHRASI